LDLLARIHRFLEDGKEHEQPIVLVIEDDPEFLEDVAIEFAEAGFYVYAARDGYEGIILAKAAKLSAVVSDLRMPRKDGVTVLRELREIDPELPMFIITGSSPGDVVAKTGEILEDVCESLAVLNCFQKPVLMTDLVDAVRLATRQARGVTVTSGDS